jgi:hypothetical protein
MCQYIYSWHRFPTWNEYATKIWCFYTHTHTHTYIYIYIYIYIYVAHLRQEHHNSKSLIFQGKFLNILKYYNFLWVQRRHYWSPAASFSNCVITIYLLKGHLQNVYFYTNNSKMPNFELWHSSRKWAIHERVSKFFR